MRTNISGKRLYERRKQCNFTQEFLGKMAKVSKQTISRIEKNEFSTVNDETLNDLAQALECTKPYLQGTVPETYSTFAANGKPLIRPLYKGVGVEQIIGKVLKINDAKLPTLNSLIDYLDTLNDKQCQELEAICESLSSVQHISINTKPIPEFQIITFLRNEIIPQIYSVTLSYDFQNRPLYKYCKEITNYFNEKFCEHLSKIFN